MDTTHNVLLNTILKLAENPTHQQTLREEFLQVIGKDNFLSAEHLPDLQYTNAVFRETHRTMNPFIFAASPRVYDYDVEVSGYNLPAGTQMMFSFDAVQNDPEV